MILSSFHRLHRLLRGSTAVLSACAATALLTGALQAKPIPSNLGNGLDKLVASHLAVTQAAAKGLSLRGSVKLDGKTYTDETAAAIAQNSLSEEGTGRLLVRVTFNGSDTLDNTIVSMGKRAGSFAVTAKDTTYRGIGVINAYVDVSEVATLASTPGVSAVFLEWRPYHSKAALQATATAKPTADAGVQPNFFPVGTGTGPSKLNTGSEPGAVVGQSFNKLGTAFDQGVILHRIDQINQGYNPSAALDLEGQGMKIGMISNSYASHTDAGGNGPTVDVNNGDLPGPGNPYNTTPVYILQDDAGAEGSTDDEGRAMTQIAYKMAPKAALAFATADGGEVGFANNIRLLGGLTVNGVTGSFGADVVCDDVGYYDEPFFQDGIIGNGVDDVTAAGVVYCSSAANDIGTNGYDSDTRWVANGTGLTAAAGNGALTGTNIDLTGVPTNLYAGGFHNFNPTSQDVAQTVNIATNNAVPTIFQWNDPYDQNTQATGTTQIYSGSGTYTNAAVTFSIPVNVVAGTNYQFVEAASGSTFDGIVTVYKSDGTTVLAGPQDTGTDETVRIKAAAADTGFVVKVDHFGTTTGNFTLNVSSYTGFSTPGPQTSLSLLVFSTTGAYISGSSLTNDATTTNAPYQFGYTNYTTGRQVQYVIARSVVPPQGNAYPTHVRYLIPSNGRLGNSYGPAEYFTYNTVTTSGHAMAQGCNGAAAYDSFRPNLPQYFTSPGPVTIYYDKNDNRLATPQVRLKPVAAATNNANISSNMSYFSSDGGSDPDTNPNFGGTSAASPHLAAIAALVLQGHGGRRSITPAQVTTTLQRSTYPHDLDPNFASGTARSTTGGKVTITISSDDSAPENAILTGTGANDTHAFAISYVGSGSVTNIVFNPQGTAATGGNITGGNSGVTYSTAATGGTVTYFENNLPGVTFLPGAKTFTQPTAAAGGAPLGVGATATFTNASSTTANQYYTMAVTPTASGTGSVLTGGNTVYFTVGRGVARTAATGAGITTVTSSTVGGALYTADIFGGGVFLPSGQATMNGMTFNGTTSDGGTFSGVIQNRIGAGWATQDGYGLVNAQAAVSAQVQ